MLFLWGKTPVNDTWKIFIWPGASPLGMIITWKLTEVCGCDCCLSVLLYSHLIWMGWKQEQALFQCEQLQKTSLNYFISLQQECCLLQHLKKKKRSRGKMPMPLEYFSVLFCMFLKPFKPWCILYFISQHFIHAKGEIFLSPSQEITVLSKISISLYSKHTVTETKSSPSSRNLCVNGPIYLSVGKYLL